MAVWKPRLVVRRGRGGAIASPADTTGFVFFGLIGVVLGAACAFIALTRDVWALIGVLMAWLPVRDAAAWLLATEAEREAFRSELTITALAAAVPPSPSNLVVEQAKPSRMAFFLVSGVAAVVVGWNFHPAFLVLGTFFLAFGVLNAVDVLRGSRKT